MAIPEQILEHSAKFKHGTWRNYSYEELAQWVNLLTKRAAHRMTVEKADKDLDDASNYLAMLKAKFDEDAEKIIKSFEMERSEVYKRIDTERRYQDLRWTPRRAANGVRDEEKPPAEWINYIEYHVSKAKERVYFLDDDTALAEIRKVAALAVRCLELHGCPERVIPEELLNEN